MDKKHLTANSKEPQPSTNSAKVTTIYLVAYVLKKKKKQEQSLLTVIFLINNAMLVFQSSWGGQWELCSKLCSSFYNGIQAC